jgi:3alpha(or 20beta)-hydroxysteroid dehydrogenase
MTEAAAVDLGHLGIRVNSVIPGPIRTEMMSGASDEGFKYLPAGRMGEPVEIASLILFLASDDAAFITGAEHVADGGLIRLLSRPT